MHSLKASILINAPVSACYERWLAFEHFPEFMHHVISVRRADPTEMLPPDSHGHKTLPHSDNPQKDYQGSITGEVAYEVAAHGNQVWHWEVRGPFGRSICWTAGIVMNEPNKAISWVSPYDQEVATSGTVNFMKASSSKPGKEQTLVEVAMSYSAPGGAFGERISDILNLGDNLLLESLEDFKSYVEREVNQTLNTAQRKTAHKAMSSEQDLIRKTGMPKTVESTPKYSKTHHPTDE